MQQRRLPWRVTATAAVLIALIFATAASAQVYVKPYTRSDGTQVQGHYRSSPDSSRTNNWSSQGNVNPYTGKQGTVDPYRYTPPSDSYSTPNYLGSGSRRCPAYSLSC